MKIPRRLTMTLFYLEYSFFWGVIAAANIRFDTQKMSDVLLAMIVGPSIGLSRGHGADFWLFSSFIVVPLLWLAVETASAAVRKWTVCAVSCIWCGLGLFLA